MNGSSGKRLREALKRVDSGPRPRAAEGFWDEFRARTALTMQEAAGRVPRVADRSLSWGHALAGLAMVVTVCLWGWFRQSPESTVTVAAAVPAAVPALSAVEEVEVFSDYSSVLIVEDEENGGTVIWVAAAEPGLGH